MPRQSNGSVAGLVAACLLLFAPGTGATSAAHAACGSSHVRATDPLVQGAFDLAMDRSATFRDLVESLRNSDLIVYVGSEGLMVAPIIGEIHFLSSAGPHRYLRVLVSSELSPWDRAAMIAHELQHALEIAATPDVRDTAAMDALYDQIGYHVGFDRHETEAAKATAALVERELRPGSTRGALR